jgi:hypothetical protein
MSKVRGTADRRRTSLAMGLEKWAEVQRGEDKRFEGEREERRAEEEGGTMKDIFRIVYQFMGKNIADLNQDEATRCLEWIRGMGHLEVPGEIVSILRKKAGTIEYPITDNDLMHLHNRCIFWLNKAIEEAWKNIWKELSDDLHNRI